MKFSAKCQVWLGISFHDPGRSLQELSRVEAVLHSVLERHLMHSNG